MSEEALMMMGNSPDSVVGLRVEEAALGAAGGAIASGVLMVYWLFCLALMILVIVGMWKMFVKAGKPGWAANVPFYNTWVLVEIAGRPWWFFFLLLFSSIIPVVGSIVTLVVWCILSNDLSKNFGGKIGTTVGLILIPFIFFPILGFGKAEYKKVTA